MRYQEEKTRPKEPLLESVDDYGSRLKGIAQNINKRHNVERNVWKNFEKYSLGTSQPFPGHSQNPLKSSPGPSWAACGSQETPKSAQERPKSRPRRLPLYRLRPRVDIYTWAPIPSFSKLFFNLIFIPSKPSKHLPKPFQNRPKIDIFEVFFVIRFLPLFWIVFFFRFFVYF